MKRNYRNTKTPGLEWVQFEDEQCFDLVLHGNRVKARFRARPTSDGDFVVDSKTEAFVTKGSPKRTLESLWDSLGLFEAA